MLTRMLSLMVGTLILTDTAALAAAGDATQARTPALELRTLLVAARGVAPSVCTLAADGVYSWGGRWMAPAEAITSDVRTRLRSMHKRRLETDDARALLDGIASADACERHLAATLIGRIGDSTIVRDLANRFDNAAPSERQAVLISFGLLDAESQAPRIVRALRDESAAVRANAAWALGRLEVKTTAAPLVASMRDQSDLVRAAGVVAFGHLGVPDSIETLIRVMRTDPSAEVRRVAAWALGELQHRGAASALVQTLASDKDEDVREMAVWALANANARESVDAVITAMRSDQSPNVRETAAWALAELNARRAVDALNEVIGKDSDSDVRGTAAWAIGQLHPGKAPANLVKAIRDADADVREKAAWALSEIADPDVAPAIIDAMKAETRDDVQHAEVRALLRSGEGSEEVFRKMLESKDPEARQMAVRALTGHRGADPWPWPWPRPRPMP